MRNYLFLLIAVALVSLVGRADTAYLYWQVNQDAGSEDSVRFDLARISVVSATDGSQVGNPPPTYLTRSDDSSTPLYVASSDGFNTDQAVASLIGSDGRDYFKSDYSFVVELLAWEQYSSDAYDIVGRSVMSYDQIQSSVAYGGTGLPSIEGAISPTSFTRVIPEPTSGLLLLVGGALLALRRKRRV